MVAVPAATSSPDEYSALEERLELILEELELAIRWGRPAILLVVYAGESVRQQAEARLEERLRAMDQRIQRLEVNTDQFDVALALAQRADREQSVFFVTGLRRGGGRDRGNAYRALNLRRELFVEYSLRVIFWLTPQEAAELPRRAPDFWAFRHRVVELPALSPGLTFETRAAPGAGVDVEDAIALREAMLADLPTGPEAQATRLSLLLDLASLHRRKGDRARALTLAQQGAALAEALGEHTSQARAWVEIGLAALEERDLETARQACQRAVELDPGNPLAWESLGAIHRASGQIEAAIAAWQKCLSLQPASATAWAGLGDVYRAQGCLDEARRAYWKATRLAPEVAAYWERLGEVLYEAGSAAAALVPLRRAIRLDGKRMRSWELLGRVNDQLGRPRAAARAYQKVKALTQEESSE